MTTIGRLFMPANDTNFLIYICGRVKIAMCSLDKSKLNFSIDKNIA